MYFEGLLISSLGMSWENILAFLVFLGGLIFYAADLKIGATLHFFMFGVLFVFEYSFGMDYKLALILMCVFAVVMAFSLYALNIAQSGRTYY